MAGKTIDELKLSDQPLAGTSKQTSTDPRQTAWYQFAQEIDDLLATGRVTYAEDTLLGIQESVRQYQTVTEGQRRAVRNIEAGSHRSERPWATRSRRYEGWSRG